MASVLIRCGSDIDGKDTLTKPVFLVKPISIENFHRSKPTVVGVQADDDHAPAKNGSLPHRGETSPEYRPAGSTKRVPSAAIGTKGRVHG